MKVLRQKTKLHLSGFSQYDSTYDILVPLYVVAMMKAIMSMCSIQLVDW